MKSRKMRLTGHVARMGDEKWVQYFAGKPEGKRPPGKPTRRWDNNNRIYLREIGWEGVDWIHVDQDKDQWQALVNTVMNLRVRKRRGIY
jgi:hypothetical protein